MNNKDFQNGFALGMATGGVVEVEIPAKEEQEKTITITENGTTEILPDTDKALSKVTVITNVKSGGASFNIAYGETPPEDTSKLWIKANEPNNIKIGSDIEKVEPYIESTGTQYIDTGIIPTNHRLKMKFQSTVSGNNTIFGSYGNETGDNFNAYEFSFYNGRWYYAPKRTKDYQGFQGNFSPNTNYYPTDVIELDFNTFDNKLIMNGITIVDTYGTSGAAIPLGIFHNPHWNIEEVGGGKLRLWYAQIYDRNTQTLVRDFVPAKDGNGVVCLYDNVTQAYFYNQGEGVFGGGSITHELTQGNIEIKTSLTENKFNFINTENAQVEIGVENVYIGNVNNEAEIANAFLFVGGEWKQISYGV